MIKFLNKLLYIIFNLLGFQRKPNKNLKTYDHPDSTQLQKVIIQTKQEAQETQAAISEISTDMQEIIDYADATLPLIPYIKPNEIEDIGVVWGEVLGQTRYVHGHIEDAYLSTGTAMGTASLTSSTTSGIMEPFIEPLPPDTHFINAWTKYSEVTSRPKLTEQVIELLKDFKLDIPPSGKKSSLELFKTAHQAYESPVSQRNPVITSLIPIRESIKTAIDELLRLRPEQEATGSSDKKKILSIGIHLKKDMISTIVVQEWADQWHDIKNKDLSASKRYEMSREEWRRKLFRATQFFHSFLSGIDPAKTRISKDEG